MVSIYEAYYREKNKQELIDINNISSDDYNNKYKGHLYCTTTNCTARLHTYLEIIIVTILGHGGKVLI